MNVVVPKFASLGGTKRLKRLNGLSTTNSAVHVVASVEAKKTSSLKVLGDPVAGVIVIAMCHNVNLS